METSSDKNCLFYTYLDKVEILHVSHNKVAPLIRRDFDQRMEQIV